MATTNQLPGPPPGREDEYPWVQAMQAARRRLPRVKVAILAFGTFALGLLAALAAGQTGSIAAASTPAATTDIFGQSTQGQAGPAEGAPGGPDNQPFNPGGGVGGGAFGGGAPTQQAPRIVTAQS